MYLIRYGKEWEKGNLSWQGMVNARFVNKEKAESFLAKRGYSKKGSDDLFTKEMDNGVIGVAIIIDDF